MKYKLTFIKDIQIFKNSKKKYNNTFGTTPHQVQIN